MPFVIKKKKETFVWPVKIKTPIDGGKYETQEIKIEFIKLKNSEIQEIMKAREAADFNFCSAIVGGWSDVTDESGAEIPFSKEALAGLLDTVGFAKEVVTQYYEALNGESAKN